MTTQRSSDRVEMVTLFSWTPGYSFQPFSHSTLGLDFLDNPGLQASALGWGGGENLGLPDES